MTPTALTSPAARPPLPYAEFVTLLALAMSLSAMAVDIMLPALPAIGEALDVAEPNRRQVVVTAYLLGFAVGQFIYGPLTDAFGRKVPLLVGLGIGVAASLACVFATSFDQLLSFRAVQGFGLAASRVISVAIVRDCFKGRHMAQVMSLVMMLFIIFPVLAPSIGQILLDLGGWTWPFYAVFVTAAALVIWLGTRLRETRAPEDRMVLSLAIIARTIADVVATRVTVAYGIAAGASLGAMFGYINSGQQIFVGLYDLGALFPVAFSAPAAMIAVAALTNNRLVGRYGMRKVSHSAVFAFILLGALLALLSIGSQPPLFLFVGLWALLTFLFGLMMPNFNAMAMEPQGHVAGTASSILGALTTVGAAILGWVVGQAYDGTILPLALGAVAAGLIVLGAALLAERGRLFQSLGD